MSTLAKYLKFWLKSLRLAEGPSALTIDLAVRATLLLLFMSKWMVGSDWRLSLPLRCLAGLGLLFPQMALRSSFWWLVSAVVMLKSYVFWWSQDNHIFVFGYWCMTLAIGFSLKNSYEVIARNAKILLGLAFLFATLWKVVLSPDFMSGDYFEFTFLTDIRFSEEAALLGNVGITEVRGNASSITDLKRGRVDQVSLASSQSLKVGTLVVTWWTAFIEGLLALTFLCPRKYRLSRLRNGALLVFSWTTYLSAPVITFGWTLNTLGLAQTGDKEHRTRLLYLFTYAVLLVYEKVPIMKYVSQFLQKIIWS